MSPSGSSEGGGRAKDQGREKTVRECSRGEAEEEASSQPVLLHIGSCQLLVETTTSGGGGG